MRYALFYWIIMGLIIWSQSVILIALAVIFHGYALWEAVTKRDWTGSKTRKAIFRELRSKR